MPVLFHRPSSNGSWHESSFAVTAELVNARPTRRVTIMIDHNGGPGDGSRALPEMSWPAPAGLTAVSTIVLGMCTSGGGLADGH